MRIMDKRYMRNRKGIENALDEVKSMEPIVFTADDTLGVSVSTGVTAQSLRGQSGLAACADLTGLMSVDLVLLVPVLVKAIQELSAEVDALKTKKTRKQAESKAE